MGFVRFLVCWLLHGPNRIEQGAAIYVIHGHCRQCYRTWERYVGP